MIILNSKDNNFIMNNSTYDSLFLHYNIEQYHTNKVTSNTMSAVYYMLSNILHDDYVDNTILHIANFKEIMEENESDHDAMVLLVNALYTLNTRYNHTIIIIGSNPLLVNLLEENRVEYTRVSDLATVLYSVKDNGLNERIESEEDPEYNDKFLNYISKFE